jgi:hypothetical protein
MAGILLAFFSFFSVNAVPAGLKLSLNENSME